MPWGFVIWCASGTRSVPTRNVQAGAASLSKRGRVHSRGTLVLTILALLLVCGLSAACLFLMSQRGLGAASRDGRLRVVSRLTLGTHQQLHLVQADSRLLLIGTGQAGAPTLLTELDPRASVSTSTGPDRAVQTAKIDTTAISAKARAEARDAAEDAARSPDNSSLIAPQPPQPPPPASR